MSARPSESATTGPVAVVFGTRPEIVKLAFVIRELGPLAWTVHTGQHWDDALVATFLRDLGIGHPSVALSTGGVSRGEQLGKGVASLSLLFARRLPRVVVVQGDTTTALAGALAANACDIPVVHVEAGLRSYDRAMPEEHNRVLVDHVAEVCCAPTVVSRDQLLAEGIAPDRVVVTGNTVVEAVHHLLPPAPARRSILIEWGLRPGAFTLATFHRPENVDGERLESLLGQLQAIVDAGWPVVLPLHPRTRARLEERHLGRALEGLTVTRPLDYPTFLGLAAEAGVLLSDSGGLQEEATVLKRPIVVVRNSTERPEAIGTFARRVPVGNEMSTIALLLLNNAEAERATLAQLPCPFGDGRASRRCATAVRRLLVDVGNAAHCPVARASTALEPSASIAPGFRVSRRPTPFTPTPPARSAPE